MDLTNSSGYILMGALLGLTAGISPGPLLALVLKETITHGKTEGIKISFVPLISDIPIVVLTLFVFSRLYHIDILMLIISLTGGLFLIYLAYECTTTKGLDISVNKGPAGSLTKAVLVNVFNPHPYLFWITVGTPMVIKASQSGISNAIFFIVAFYLLLIGSKIGVVLIVDRTRKFLTDNIYIWLMRILGLSLFIFSALFFYESFKIVRGLL